MLSCVSRPETGWWAAQPAPRIPMYADADGEERPGQCHQEMA